jgi:predicted nucleotidyltransferase component of viral defense system
MGSSEGSSDKDPLTPLQREVLQAFFERETGFFLTGGAALAGFHLHHRETNDLDLFTEDPDVLERGHYALVHAAEALNASWEIRQQAPGFRRYVLSRDDDLLVVDLALDRTKPVHPEKPTIGRVRVDPPDEILVNKLTALVGRAEIRDLVDVMALEQTGLRVEDALHAALEKDGGCTPASLAWVLSQVRISDSSRLPGDADPAAVNVWLDQLVRRLRRAAAPAP